MEDEILQKVIEDIDINHRKIIDDWCKAYMAQLYQENGSIKPGDFVLVEQVPTYYKGNPEKLVRKYWFEPKEDFDHSPMSMEEWRRTVGGITESLMGKK